MVPEARIHNTHFNVLTMIRACDNLLAIQEGPMNVRPLSLIVSTALMLPVCSVAVEWKHPRTPWGDPDLRGTWPVVHLISVPLERPPQYGDRLNFTEEEMAEQRKRIEARNQRYQDEDAADRIGQGHWAEVTELPPQTSLIVDPPNGRLPPLTDAGKEMSARMGSSWNRQVFDSIADFDG
jgi:hypothetical protein